MKKKSIWLILSCLMVLSLVLASCASAVTEEEEAAAPPGEEEKVVTEEEVVTEEKEMVRDSLGRLVEKPRYGGRFIQVWTQDALCFDGAFGHNFYTPTLHFTNEDLLTGDWAKGPAGTNEASWLYTIFPSEKVQGFALAESWELAGPTTLIFHIRKGVHFHDKPPTNGREMTADDVVFSIKRMWELKTSPVWQNFQHDPHIKSITAPDKWTVVIETNDPKQTGETYQFCSDWSFIVPPEAVEEYGDLNDWENAVGTGPYVLLDYVKSSSATLVRNPNYWREDPLHPKNQLPYLDSLKCLVIVDLSTRMAAMRTAKIDWLPGLTWEDGESLLKTNPELQYLRYSAGSCAALQWRVDKPELPFYDKRVRRALCMAVNQQLIADTYYGGNADPLVYPIAPLAEYMDIYTPLDELPESSRELYEYHPEKARQLLAEAGYPDGFRTEVICIQSQVDLLSIVKDMWKEVGVDLEILVKEYGAYVGMRGSAKYNEIFMGGVSGTIPFDMYHVQKGGYWNQSKIDDPVINDAYDAITAAFFDEPERRQLMKEVASHIIDQAYQLELPGSYYYTLWQPWVKNYHGEIFIGWSNLYDFPKYIWLDQDLKEEMTGKR